MRISRFLLRRLVRDAAPVFGFIASLAAVEPVFASDHPALDNRTIRFIIGTAAGGGNDTLGRLLASSMAKFLPQTSVRTQNMAGAGGGVAVAALQADNGNLVSMAFTTSGIIYGQLISDQPKFDIRDLHWIGSVGNDRRLLAIRTSLGITDWHRLSTVGRQLIWPTNGNLGQSVTTEAFIIDALTGKDFKIVPGVEEGQIAALLMSGDSDLTAGSYGSLKAMIDAGTITPILRYGHDGYPPALDKVPTIAEVATTDRYEAAIKLIEAVSTNGRLLTASPSTPPEVVSALQSVFNAAIRDPDYIAATEKLGYLSSSVEGTALATRINGFLAEGEALRTLLQAAIACGQGLSAAVATPCP